MAGISTSIQLNDRMTPILNSITTAMNLMVSSFSAAQTASATAVNTAGWTAAVDAVHSASAAVAEYQQELERTQNKRIPEPVAPTWNGISTPEVFMNSGADRFVNEYQAASQMAQRLYQNQRAISDQARAMKVIPPGMMNDVSAVSNRVQALSVRIQQLDQIPIELRTDQVNRDIEGLRGNLNQALGIQEDLNQAMSRMDISAANTAYQRLNQTIDTAERNIRDNISAQDEFNQSLQKGSTAASGLESNIKRYAAILLSAATAGKIINVADEMSQTAARLNLVNDGLQTTDQLQQMIYQSAQRSRAAYTTTAGIVARLGQNAKTAFASNAETIQFAENLNKQFAIAGASQQEMAAASLQLTQALGSGVLRGEELNSVFEAAPNVIQTIADYMGVPIGEVRKLASEGVISAEIVKNAMLNATDEINAKFSSMPMTFGQVANSIQNQALMAFQPALEQLNAVTQTEGFATLAQNVTDAIQILASGSVQALNLMGQAAVFVQENWSWLEPVIWGVVGAFAAYNIVTGLSNSLAVIHAALKTKDAGCSMLAAAAIFIQTLAQEGLNAALSACPLMWIAVLIGVVIAAIVAWVRHVGGIRVAWLICVNAVLTQAELLQWGLSLAWHQVQNGIDSMQLGFDGFRVGVLNALGNLKVMGLTILQSFINGAIDRINALIGFAQSIGVTSIDMITPVEFAASAAVEEKANQQQWAADLAAKKYQNAADRVDRMEGDRMMLSRAKAAQAERKAEIEAAKAESTRQVAENQASGGGYAATPAIPGLGDIGGNTGRTADNTAAMADAMDLMDEDLKYMRDAAEQEIINRFTLAELKVDVRNHNTLTKKTDFDDMGRYLAVFTGEFLAAAAEGGHL